ncbi:MAG: C25 family cysteine peptidase [Chloroflexota bacterium]
MLFALAFTILSKGIAFANACAWTGATSADWADASNWSGCGGVTPQATDTVTIPDVTNDPVLSGDVSIAGLTINSGAVLALGSRTLTLTDGGITNNGTLSGDTGTLVLDFATSRTLDGSGNYDLNHLTLDSSVNLSNNVTLHVGGNFSKLSGSFQCASSQSNPSNSCTLDFDGGGTSTFSWTTSSSLPWNITVQPGTTVTLGATNSTFTLRGNLEGDGTFTASGGTITFSTVTTANLAGSKTLNNVTVNTTNGITLGSDVTVNGTLTLTNGKVATGANALLLGSGATVSGAGAGRYVYGNLQKAFNAGSGQSFTFDIGDATSYTPAALANFNATNAGTITASTTAARHPEFLSADIGDKYVKRYWTLTPGGGLATGGYDITLTFVAGDLVGSPNTSALIVQKYSCPSSCGWSNPTTSSSTSTTVTGTGFTSFSDFFAGEGGEPTPVTLSYFHAQRQGTRVFIEWSTATEIGNVGFHLYAERDGRQIRLNPELIPSHATDSLNRQDYAFGAETEGDLFYIEDVNVLGQTERFGPFQADREYGSRVAPDPIDWSAIRADHPIGADAPSLDPNLAALSGSIQILVRQTGMARVTYESLRAAGLDLAGVPYYMLRLTNRGQAVPIYVKGRTFGPGAYFEFYGQALDTIYTDTNVYLLSAGRERGLLIPQERSFTRLGTNFPASFAHTMTVERRRAFASFYALGDGWYDTSMLAYAAPKSWSFPFTVTELADASAPASLDLTVWGVTDWPQAPDHHLVARVNGVQVASEFFNGLVELTIHADIPPGVLQPGANTLELVLPGDTGVNWDMVNLDKFSVTYQRAFRAESGRLAFTAAGKAFKVTNLPTRNIAVYRVEPNGPARIANIQIQASGSTYNVLFPGMDKPARYIVTTAEAMLAPAFQPVRVPASDLDRPAEYLVISHPDFIPGLQPLIQARQAQGLAVNVVDVNDVYARYSYGVFDAQAIRDYIAFARQNLGTEMVLLVGGDTYDYRNYLGLNSVSFIPSLYASTGPTVHFVPVDPLYADVNGDNVPDLAIGRFPVRTNAELDLMVNKTLAYAGKDYRRTAVYASDYEDSGVSFKNINLGFASLLPGDWTAEHVSLDDLSVNDARARLLDAMNRGSAMVTFMGHSGPTVWTFSGLFSTLDAAALTNAGRPFVAVQYGCWNAYYVDPANNYLAQALLFSGDKGAAAILGGVTLTYSESEAMLGDLLTPRMVAPGAFVGPALYEAKAELAQSHPELLDVLLGWTLMGDPALIVEP